MSLGRTRLALGELVVVDNGSTDRTGEILKEYATKAPFPTKVLYQAPPGKSRGLNQALQVTRGEIIALIDDDCYVAPDYIDRVHETFADPRIGFAGGRIDLFDPTDYPTTIKTSEQWELIKPRTFVLAGALQGANTMYRRQVLEEIGGFDPDLGPGSRFYGEELDVQTRASFAGWYGLYTPDVKVAHHHGRKAKDLPALFRAYSVGEGAYKAKLSLLPETRPVVLPLVIRNWHWLARKGLRRSYERRADRANLRFYTRPAVGPPVLPGLLDIVPTWRRAHIAE